MLKKSGAIIICVLYLAIATGFALDIHYCCSQLTSVDFNLPAKFNNATKFGKTKCCDDRRLEVKIKDVHQGEAASKFLAKTFVFELPKFHLSCFFLQPHYAFTTSFADRAPPNKPLDGVVTFLKNCTFRI